MSIFESDSGKSYDDTAAPSAWDTVRATHQQKDTDNVEYLQGVKGDSIRGESIAQMFAGGGATLYTCKYGTGGPSTLTLIDPSKYEGSAIALNADTLTDCLKNRDFFIAGTVNLGASTTAIPGGGAEAYLNTNYEETLAAGATVLRDTVTVNTADKTLIAAFYSGSGIADESGSENSKARIVFYKPTSSADQYTLIFYVDSSTGKLRMYWNGESGVAFKFQIGISPRYDL